MFRKCYYFVSLLVVSNMAIGAAMLHEEKENIAIIGSGSGAFAAAIQSAKNGAKVTMIESGTLGGTCVNVGCVPSKIFIRAGHLAHLQKSNPFAGLAPHEPGIDPAKLLMQQQSRVEELRQKKYADILAATPEVTFVQGRASFVGPTTLLVRSDGLEDRVVKAGKILIATGSHPYIPEIPGLKESPYWTSTSALQSGEVPRRLIVLGGSVVALELAQAFSHYGSDVTILARSTLLSSEDAAIGSELFSIFEKEGIHVFTHTVPTSIEFDGSKFIVQLGTGKGPVEGEKLLVATGRHATTTDLNLVSVGVATDKIGRIIVDSYLKTSVANIYAVGDCTILPQYVYVAAAAGTRAAINMLGGHEPLDLSILPKVVFTTPQVGTIGVSEEEAITSGIEYETRVLPMGAVPRALANFDERGLIKLITTKGTRQILGAHIIAENAGDIIQTVALAMKGRMTVRDISTTLFPYLTGVEGLKLCAQIFFTDVSKLSCCADASDFDEKATVEAAGGAGHACCRK